MAKVTGVEPTNSHAERSLRGAVIYRRLSLGTHSRGGERRRKRLRSAHASRRLQRRLLFDCLTELFAAHARGEQLPALA